VIFILPSHESLRRKNVRAPFLSEPSQIYDEENPPTRSKSLLDSFSEKVKGRGEGEGQRIKLIKEEKGVAAFHCYIVYAKIKITLLVRF